jgi:hypothetical protein
MTDARPGTSNPGAAPTAASAPTPAAQKPSAQAVRRRATSQPRRTQGLGLLIVSTGFLVVSSLCFAAVITKTILASQQLQTTNATPEGDVRAAQMKTDADAGDRCPQRVFDNQTGRMIDAQGPCSDIDDDANGMPVLRGTRNRRDGIETSVSNR